MKIRLLIILLLVSVQVAKSQIDKEFWFVAPEVSVTHGDRPIYLKITSFDKAANILVDMPANSSFTPISFKVNAQTGYTLDLSSYIALLEITDANKVTNQGLHITSDQEISAYYEVAHKGNNDIFTLKGRNALGTDFYTPFQSDFTNGTYSPVNAYSSIDIVATEDNTIIKINPTNAVTGHASGVEYSVTLNKGQTYSARAIGSAGSAHLMGTHITSNKPIAVSIKDDSITSEPCHDLVGDQIVPVPVTGTEYIAVKGFLASTTQDHLYILATQEQTKIYLDGATSPAYTLNTGKQQSLALTSGTKYIKSSAPVYVLHVSGFGCEMGGAVLPHIACTGSSEMSFTRTSTEYFGMVLLIQNGMQDKFVLNGSKTAITASMFSVVPGTNNQWVSASIDLTSIVPTGSASRISNTESLFNMGIINGGEKTGCKYGYFSDYSSLNIGADELICDGDTIELDAQRTGYSYLWSTGDTTQAIKVTRQGIYSVTIKKNQCVLKDTMELLVNPKPKIDLGNDSNICIGSKIKLDAGKNFKKYEWYDKTTGQTIMRDTTGTYWAKVTDYNNCENADTISVTVRQFPKIVSGDTTFCGTFQGKIQATMDQEGIGKWSYAGSGFLALQTPDSLQTLVSVAKFGTYDLNFKATSIYGCVSDNSIKASFFQKPLASFSMDSSKCYGDNVKISYTGNASDTAKYYWNFDDCVVLSGEKQGPYNIALGAVADDKLLSLTVFENGCMSDSAKKTLKVSPNFSMKSDTSSGCEPVTIHFNSTSNRSDITCQWTFDNTTSTLQNPVHQFVKPGKYDVSLLITAKNGCQNAYKKKDMIQVYQIPTAKISLDDKTCYRDTINLEYTGNASGSANYTWDWSDISVVSGNGQGPFSLNIGQADTRTIRLSVEENACYSDTISVKLKRIPHINILTNSDAACEPFPVNFSETNQEPDMLYVWDFGDGNADNSDTSKLSHIYQKYGNYTASLKVTSNEACSNVKQKVITVYKRPEAAFSLTPTETVMDNPTITFTNTSNEAVSYLWDFGDNSTSKEANPVYAYSQVGEYDIKLVIYSENNCTDTATNHVTIGMFLAPNAFVPNSQVEKNRTFIPVSIGMELDNFEFKVFNRWGAIVFESEDTALAWNGKINERDAESGAYAWTVTYSDIRGNRHKHSGTVLLIR